MNCKGTQIALDMYSCNEAIICNETTVKELLLKTISGNGLTEQAVYFTRNPYDSDYYYVILCLNGIFTIHIYPALGFVTLDIFTSNDAADPEKLAIILRKEFSPDKSQITFLQRGNFGSQHDMKPRRRSQVRPVRRAKNAGYVIKELMLKPKSL